jgi:Protein of unknown function (DUF3987)
LTATTQIRLQFFDLLFREQEGYICLATTQAHGGKATWKQTFYEWPRQRKELNEFIDKIHPRRNVYFSVNLFDRPARGKDYTKPSRLVWGDFDTADPMGIEPQPSVVIQSSPGRYQPIWILDNEIDPYLAEEYSKRLAYLHRPNGSDVSGWDLGQMLRVPFTFNYKYDVEGEGVPEVDLVRGVDERHSLAFFDELPQAGDVVGGTQLGDDMPEVGELPDPQLVLYKYSRLLRDTAFDELYHVEPATGADWSALLWKFLNICFEASMEPAEVFTLAIHCKVNKYERDNRPIRHLWREVQKCQAKYLQIPRVGELIQPLAFPVLYEGDRPHDTVVDEFIEWATDQTDAPPIYHELGGFILLSSMLAGGLRCYPSFSHRGLVPNLWGILLGSSLTRKTTAQDLVMDFVFEIDADMMLATDGSAEGLLSGLARRPSRVSIYARDEVAGMIAQINKREYLAGLPETLSKLYDSPKKYTRILRKETITVTNPVFIFYGGGIRDRFYELIDEHYITTGFLPRFLVVSAEPDPTRLRAPGPATAIDDLRRDAIKNTFVQLKELYCQERPIKLPGENVAYVTQEVQVFLTEQAWLVYGEMEQKLEFAAVDTPWEAAALPMLGRLARSLFKMALLSGASRREPKNNTVTIDDTDIQYAAWYIQRWGEFTIDLITNAGQSVSENQLSKVLRSIERKPGIYRSEIMRTHHLSKRETDNLLETLEAREHITMQKEGRGYRLWPT